MTEWTKYQVELVNVFDAATPEDAVIGMREWVREAADYAIYRVRWTDPNGIDRMKWV